MCFINLSIYIVIHTWYIDRELVKKDPGYKSPLLRHVFGALSIIFVVAMILFFCFPASEKYPYLVSSIFEVLAAISFELWWLTFYNSFPGISHYQLDSFSVADLIEDLTNKENGDDQLGGL